MQKDFTKKEQEREKLIEPSTKEKKIEYKPEEKIEKREFLREKELVREKLREELERLEKMEVTPEIKEEIEKEVKQIKDTEEKGKIYRLLNLAKEKGLFFAVTVAKKTDPYTLDLFHDVIIEKGLYKTFLKQ